MEILGATCSSNYLDSLLRTVHVDEPIGQMGAQETAVAAGGTQLAQHPAKWFHRAG